MAAEVKERWLNYLSATTVIIAVCATLSTFKGGGYSTRAILNQSKASDQWSYYQAKGIKSYLYEIQIDNLKATLHQGKDSTGNAAIQARINQYKQKIDKYASEKKDIEKQAKEFEGIRDDSRKHSDFFGIAVIFLQVGILLSSIAALIRKKILWYISVGMGLIGIIYFVNGFFLFF